ncbi:MAG: DUF2771 family protein [Jatrophihabitans sp.]|uniref:DUF2771 family protein n=1 Tax=Jatrophihabitans sp. TaxID=1932789 RepID=UPI003F7FEEFA
MIARARRLRSSSRRPLALAGVLVASVGLLAACDKPVPQVTVQSGSDSTTVDYLSFCFDKDHCHYRKGAGGTLHVAKGATILVDVPRAIAKGQWSVRSAQFVGNGTAKALQDPGVNSGVRKDTHTARLQVATSVNDYYLVVTSANGTQVGQWVAEVKVDN